MAKKRLQKKKAAARAEAERIKSTSNAPQTSTLKIETEKTEPIKVETSKIEPVKVETKKTEPIKVETSKTEPVKISAVEKDDSVYQTRLNHHMDELKWLYCELYQDDPLVMEHLSQLLDGLKTFYDTRNTELKASDLSREKDSLWYKRNDLTGMMMYVSSFAKTLKGLELSLIHI